MTSFKKGLRGTLCLLLVLLLLLSLPLSASAAESEASEDAEPTVTETASPAEGETGDDTVTTLLYGFVTDNLSGILSGATFLLALILSLALRKRVMPSLLDTLSGILSKSRDLGEALTAKEAEGRAELELLFREAERILGEAKLASDRAEEVAAAIRESEGGRAEAALILREQTTLLYELLMSANLPQYQKDRIGEAHAAATAALSELSHG